MIINIKQLILSRCTNYDMDTALNEIKEKKLLLDVKVETQKMLVGSG